MGDTEDRKRMLKQLAERCDNSAGNLIRRYEQLGKMVKEVIENEEMFNQEVDNVLFWVLHWWINNTNLLLHDYLREMMYDPLKDALINQIRQIIGEIRLLCLESK
jgi:hypothetical protein